MFLLSILDNIISDFFSDLPSNLKELFESLGVFFGWILEVISGLIISSLSEFFDSFLVSSKSDFIIIGDNLIGLFFSFFRLGSADFFSYLVGLLFFLFLFRLLWYFLSNLFS